MVMRGEAPASTVHKLEVYKQFIRPPILYSDRESPIGQRIGVFGKDPKYH